MNIICLILALSGSDTLQLMKGLAGMVVALFLFVGILILLLVVVHKLRKKENSPNIKYQDRHRYNPPPD